MRMLSWTYIGMQVALSVEEYINKRSKNGKFRSYIMLGGTKVSGTMSR